MFICAIVAIVVVIVSQDVCDDSVLIIYLLFQWQPCFRPFIIHILYILYYFL